MKTRTKTRTIPKTPFFAAFSVGAVLFSAHAGGGFATGNQANTYYVGLGWAGIVSAIVAMLLLTLTMREAMIMYNSRGLTSYKQLFETLYHPFDKIEWLFEIFFYIMVLMAVAAAISGAASALRSYFGVNYYLGVVAVGCLVLLLTIFGAGIDAAIFALEAEERPVFAAVIIPGGDAVPGERQRFFLQTRAAHAEAVRPVQLHAAVRAAARPDLHAEVGFRAIERPLGADFALPAIRHLHAQRSGSPGCSHGFGGRGCWLSCGRGPGPAAGGEEEQQGQDQCGEQSCFFHK